MRLQDSQVSQRSFDCGGVDAVPVVNSHVPKTTHDDPSAAETLPHEPEVVDDSQDPSVEELDARIAALRFLACRAL